MRTFRASDNPDQDAKIQMQKLSNAQSALAHSGPVGWSEFPPKSWLLAYIGWMLTAFASLLGGAILVQRAAGLVGIRNAGPKPASSTSSGA